MRTAHLLVLSALTACTAPPAEVVDPQVDSAAPGLYEWLSGEQVPTSDVIRAEPDADALAVSMVQDEPRYRVGIAVPVQELIDLGAATPTSGGAPADVADGAIRFTADGFVWSAVVESPGATSLRVGIENLDLPDGAELYLYNDLGDVAGPYRGTGPAPDQRSFYTATLATDLVHLQIRYDGPDVVAALDQIQFTLADVGYLDQRFIIGRLQVEPPGLRAHCSNLNATCVQNAECDLQADPYDGVVDALRTASGEMLFQSGSSWYLCTGTLIRSLDGSLGHFWTAHHCVSTTAEAASLQTYYDFTVPCPPGGGATTTCDYADSTNSHIPSSFGATIIDTSSTTDFTLMQLNGTPPAGTAPLPYSTQAVATVNNTRLHRVSYPAGAPQAYSEHTVDSAFSTCGAPGNFMYSRDVIGATEGGSSGSAAVNDNGEIVGQLYGACGSHLNDDCDAVNNRTYDGAFAATWATRPLVRHDLAQEPLPVEVVLSNQSIPSVARNGSWTTSFNNGTTTPTYGNLTFKLAGPNGDGDLYVKRGSAPTTTSYDCRPYLTGTNETCMFDPTQAGTYYVMVRAYAAFSGASLKISTFQSACVDTDADGVCATVDNCPTVANPTQANADGDSKGDACDACPNDAANDADADGVCGNVDNCPTVNNPTQANADADGLGDACDACPSDALNDGDGDTVCGNVDNCPTTSNASQANADGDTFGDACDACPSDALNDGDADGVCGNVDNCPTTSNPTQADTDGDGYGDDCDTCPADPDDDADGDLICGDADNCPDTANADQDDTDLDGVGDACDQCPDGLDSDNDGLCDDDDNCPDDANHDQDDSDLDFVGDACDVCPTDPGNDSDNDGECGDTDNCPAIANPGQANADGDAFGDACDSCPADAANDSDADGVCADVDNCPTAANPTQTNTDGDTLGDVCDTCPSDALNDADADGRCADVDNCPTIANPTQTNTDGDTLGDVCDTCPSDALNDADADGRCANVDNCPTIANSTQTNTDGDTLGDACDTCPSDALNDADADGRCANVDNCPTVANSTQTNTDGDTLGDVCDTCPTVFGTLANGCPADTTPPTISNRAQQKSGSKLKVTFTTNEPATGHVCASGGQCVDTALGTSHNTGFFHVTGNTYTIKVTDGTGNAATYGPFQQ